MRRDVPGHAHRSSPSWRGCLVLVFFALVNSWPSLISASPIIAQNPAHDEAGTLLEQLQDAFESLAARVEPATVTIQAERGPGNPKGVAASSADVWTSTGAGVIVRSDGVILTNQHVIEGATLIRVTLHDGRRRRAALLGADARADLAVLRVQGKNLHAAELGDAGNLRRGHLVLAFGSPLGVASDGQIAFNQGVVAAVGRPLPDSLGKAEDRYYGDMIQTTIRVGPGDSGGPLVDIHGRVIGLMTAMGGAGASSDGFGLAVPMNARTKSIVQRLIEGRPITYGYMGIEVGEASVFGAQANRAAPDHGVRVDSVLRDGPAARAGLREGDLILAVDGTEVRSPDHFVQLIGELGPGRSSRIQFERDSRRDTAVVELSPRPELARSDARPSRTVAFRGAVLGEISPAMRAAINAPESAMLVVMVNSGSPAHRAGLTPGDVIVRVDGEPLRSDATVRLAAYREDVLLGLANGGSVLLKPD